MHQSRLLAVEDAAVAVAENAALASGVVLASVVVAVAGMLLGLRTLLSRLAA
jgi:hypothetical protein